MMTIQRAYKVELRPTSEQRLMFARCSGVARYCWNRGVGELLKQLQQWRDAVDAYAVERGLDPKEVRRTWRENRKLLIADGLVLPKREPIDVYKLTSADRDAEVDGRPWIGEVPATLRAQAQQSFRRVMDLYYKRNIQRPRFAGKHKRKPSFALQIPTAADQTKIFVGATIKMPGIGVVRCTEVMGDRVQGRAVKLTISRDVDRWYCSVGVMECPRPSPTEKIYARGGFDLNTHSAVFAHEGGSIVFQIPPRLAKLHRQVAHAQRELSRRRRPKGQPQSENYKKTKLRLGKLYRTQRRVREDWLHKMTTHLAKSCARLTVEDLNVRGMTRSAKGDSETPGKNVAAKSGLNRAILNAAFSECRRQLTYKASWYGCELIVADRYFPSSKRCSSCGARHESLRLGDHTYRCTTCGLIIDRDLNAAINLRDYDSTADAKAADVEGPGDTGVLKPTERKTALPRPKRSTATIRDEVGTTTTSEEIPCGRPVSRIARTTSNSEVRIPRAKSAVKPPSRSSKSGS